MNSSRSRAIAHYRILAWSRSRVSLNTDENELQYLQDELSKLKEKKKTAAGGLAKRDWSGPWPRTSCSRTTRN